MITILIVTVITVLAMLYGVGLYLYTVGHYEEYSFGYYSFITMVLTGLLLTIFELESARFQITGDMISPYIPIIMAGVCVGASWPHHAGRHFHRLIKEKRLSVRITTSQI